MQRIDKMIIDITKKGTILLQTSDSKLCLKRNISESNKEIYYKVFLRNDSKTTFDNVICTQNYTEALWQYQNELTKLYDRLNEE